MSTRPDAATARRYLLGATTEEESTALEHAYLAADTALEEMRSAEDDLIDDYLDDVLSVEERARFEDHYMAAPTRRTRVETVRRIRAASVAHAATVRSDGAAAPRSRTSMGWMPWLALAATVAIALGGYWLSRAPSAPATTTASSSTSPQTGASSPPATPPASTASPDAPSARMLVLSLAAIAVRGANAAQTVAPTPSVERLRLQLQDDGEGRRLKPTRIEIRTVGGTVVWQGPVDGAAPESAGVVAAVAVPVASVPPDDYVVTLMGTDEAGREGEWAQYMLSVRRP